LLVVPVAAGKRRLLLVHFALWPLGPDHPAQLDNGSVTMVGFEPWQIVHAYMLIDCEHDAIWITDNLPHGSSDHGHAPGCPTVPGDPAPAPQREVWHQEPGRLLPAATENSNVGDPAQFG